MRLFDRQGQGIALEILGYEFPELADVPYDSNWLQVRVDVRYPEGRWQGVDPCLLTYEARELAEWLERVAAEPRVGDQIAFFEPLLAFGTPGPRHVRVTFWHPQQDREHGIDLAHDADALRAAAGDLWQALARYPQRTAR